jgi:superoxide dismutase, Cu-Zn family
MKLINGANMIRVTLSATVLLSLLSHGCAKTEVARTPQPMNADGSGPSYNGPGTPWQDPDLSKPDKVVPAGTVVQSDRRASSTIMAAPGYQLAGVAQFSEVREGVKIRVEVSGAPPGKKEIHIHQTADCTDIPNKSMGNPFAPEKDSAGLPDALQHQLGDLGNIEIAEDGTGTLEIVVADANLKAEDARSFVTRSIVLHETEDSRAGESDDSGRPIACGPIIG